MINIVDITLTIRLKINSAKLYVTLESDNDSNVGYGFSISQIEKIPYSMLFGIH